jgi:predicted nucleotidyltransferase
MASDNQRGISEHQRFSALVGARASHKNFIVAESRVQEVVRSRTVCGWEMRPVVIMIEEMIREMAAVVAREVEPEAIILFGSHATGDARPDSDVDLLVIEATPFGPGRDRRGEMIRLWRALSGFAVGKDILVYSRDEVERWRDARNHVVARALREGRLLYGTLG